MIAIDVQARSRSSRGRRPRLQARLTRPPSSTKTGPCPRRCTSSPSTWARPAGGVVLCALSSNNRLTSTDVHRFEHRPVHLPDDTAAGLWCWDVPAIWSNVKTGIAKAAAAAGGDIAGIGIDAWGVGLRAAGRRRPLNAAAGGVPRPADRRHVRAGDQITRKRRDLRRDRRPVHGHQHAVPVGRRRGRPVAAAGSGEPAADDSGSADLLVDRYRRGRAHAWPALRRCTTPTPGGGRRS